MILDQPILLAVVLPIIGVLATALLPGPIILTLRACGVADENFISIINAILMDVFRLLIFLLFIWLVKCGLGKEFKIGFNKDNIRKSLVLAAFGLLVALYN